MKRHGRANAFERNVERAFARPARVLEKSVRASRKAERSLLTKRPLRAAERYWETLGPGLTTGAADDDPSGIATYSQAGARYGTQLVWLNLYMLPLMAVVQEMCARIGIVTGKGLAANIRHHYSDRALYTVAGLLFFVNAINIAADLNAMAASSQLLFPSVSGGVLIVAFALASLLLQVFTTYARYARYLKYLAMALLAYVVAALFVHLDWGLVLHHLLVPSVTFSGNQLFLICAILGTTISPYLFFWQTSQEVEEGVLRGESSIAKRRAAVTPELLSHMRTDVWSGMAFSSTIAFFIFAACAGALFQNGVVDISSAAQAADALKPFGSMAYLLFALGVVGTGFLAVPVLAGSSAYALSESFGWRAGLYRRLKHAHAFYGVIIISMLFGMLANMVRLNPIHELIYAAVANGLLTPIVLYYILRISGDRRAMGKHRNGFLTSLVGWGTWLVMVAAGCAAVLSVL